MQIINTSQPNIKHLFSLIFFALAMFGQPSISLADVTQSDVKKIRINGYDMSYVERGDGEPLILIHGSLSDYRTWLPLLEEFSETNRTITLSLRHSYPEQWDGKGNDLSLQQHANDVAAFIEALSYGPVSLLGHSRGGGVALLVASQHPQLVSKLILADPTPLTTMLPKQADVQAAANKRNDQLHEVLSYYQRGDTEGGLELFVNYVAGNDAWKRTPENVRNVLRTNVWTQLSVLSDSNTQFTCKNARSISAPVLLVTSDRSPPLYGYMNSALQPCLRQVSNVTIADAGHMMFQANPSAFVFEVQDFILK